MYRKIMWCYVILLTILDISLNSKLTAQGKSHGTSYSVHDTLAEGVNFQEWGKESNAGGGAESEEPAERAVRLVPAALEFGRRALGAAHAATVTLVNVANVTLHLASVAGTTPDFHASFFHTKTLAPQGNTTFNVVYLGRHETRVSAQLFIHTSLGVYKYQVSALGVASEWEVWPLLGVRVPHNATVQPLLTLRNPTAHPVQVTEVYSSGGWVKLVLPDEEGGGGVGEGEGVAGGGGGFSAAAWVVPPHAARPLLRLRLSPPHHAHHATAYVRIKTNSSSGGGGSGSGGGGGGDLIVAVEARAVAGGEFAAPLQLRLAARGHLDPPDTWEISVGSSAGTGGRLEAGVTGARCEPHPRPPEPPEPAASPAQEDPPDEHLHAHQNGVKSSGASVSLLRPDIEPYQELTAAAQLTLDYEKLWSEFSSDPSIEPSLKTGGAGAFCSGTLTLGRAAVPYSLRLLHGTLALTPSTIDLITSELEGGTKETKLVAENMFSVPIRLVHLEYPDSVANFVQVTGFAEQVLQPKTKAVVARLQLKEDVGMLATLDVKLVLHTNISMYSVPLRMYSGKLELEWEWPATEEGGGHLSVGALGTSMTRRIGCVVRNPAPAPLCVRALSTDLPGAQLALPACTSPPPRTPQHHACRCIEAGGWTRAVLTVVAPARPGALRGTVSIATAHATTQATVSLTAHAGRVAAAHVHLEDAAPYAWAMAPVIIDNSMSLRMRVLGWSDGAGSGAVGGSEPDLALTYRAPPAADVPPGRAEVGHITYMPERLCEPNCYTGLDVNTEEGMAWLANGEAWYESPAEAAIEKALRADRALLMARRALFQPRSRNISLHVRTTQVVQVPVRGWVRLSWPRLTDAEGGGGDAGLAGVGGTARLKLRARNPSRSHSLLLQPVLGPLLNPTPDVWEDAESPLCARETCAYALDAFRLSEWRVRGGDAREYTQAAHAHAHRPAGAGAGNWSVSLPMLVLGPSAEIELTVSFIPARARPLTAYLYLRNNLTILEGIQVAGRGAVPSFEIGGRRPGQIAPLVFEVTECGQAGVVRRVLAARNTGPVPVRLRDWRVGGAAGGGCAARGFALTPCAPLSLQPNQSAPLTITFTPDFTLARVQATLELRTERARFVFHLAALISPSLLAKCSVQVSPPPFEAGLKAGGTLLALALLAVVLGAAALDAERLLRKARAARVTAQPRAPLDLRAVAAAPAPAPPPVPLRAPPPKRRKVRKMDPAAESRAFERWRASLRRPDDTDSRSSEDLEQDLSPTDPSPPDNVNMPPSAPPPPYEPLLESECRPPASSGEDEPQSSESECSSPIELEADDESRPPKEIKPRTYSATADTTQTDNTREKLPSHTPVESHTRARRRDAENRRSERRAEADNVRGVNGGVRGVGGNAGGGHAAVGVAKPHARKDKPRARRERAAPTPPRSSPPTTEPRAGSASSSNGAGGCAGGGGGGVGGAGGAANAVRWGASWSSVVARSSATPPSPAPSAPAPPTPPALAPAAPPPAEAVPHTYAHAHTHPHPARPSPPTIQTHRPATDSNSLFYFNSEPPLAPPHPPPVAAAPRRTPPATAPPEYAWPPPTPPPSAAPAPTPYLAGEENVGGAAYGSIGAGGLWGPGGGGGGSAMGGGNEARGAPACAWPWAAGGSYCPAGTGSAAVRPPPGFGSGPGPVGAVGAAPGPVGSRTVRPFDPFQSLAAIWSRTALDWRDPQDQQRDRDHTNHN